MKNFEIDVQDRKILEESNESFAIYQYNGDKLECILVSEGICKILKVNHQECLDFLNKDMFKYVEASDKKKTYEKAYHFATHGGTYNVKFKTKSPKLDNYVTLNARGHHIFAKNGIRLGFVYYLTDKMLAEINDTPKDYNFYGNSVLNLTKNFSATFSNSRDDLTGLLSTFYFLELADTYFNQSIKLKKHPAIIAFDLIGMHNYNQAYGFQEGNHLIEGFGDILRIIFGDLASSRFVVDHFYVYCAKEDVEDKIDKVFKDLKELNNGKTLDVRAGVYIHRSTKKISITTACERAKSASDYDRNVVKSTVKYFDEKMLEQNEKEKYIISNLDKALEEKWIKIFYQPIFRSVNDKICNCEALSRWIDPKLGVFYPIEFIPILEKSKLLYKLDLYVIDEIINDFKIKKDNDIEWVPVSINLSRYDFDTVDMVSIIAEKFKKANISTQFLAIEITESVVGANPDEISQIVKRFHLAGFQVWMDDFGSGYSSLNTMVAHEFDLVKLDMQFIRGYSSNPKIPGLIKNVIRMAQDLNIDTLCEGVETNEELQFLRNCGCDKIQGYVFSRPVSIETIIKTKNKFKREDIREASYYDKIGSSNLYNPKLSGRGSSSIEKFLIGASVGILEYSNGVFYFLRGTSTYRNFLSVNGLCDFNQDYNVKVKLKGMFSRSFINACKRSIASGAWELSNYQREDGFVANDYVKTLGYNQITDSHSLMVIMSSAKQKIRNYSKLDIVEVPVPMAIFKVVLNEAHTKVKDCIYTYVNEAYCNAIRLNEGDLLNKSYIKSNPNAIEGLLKYFYRSAVEGKTIQDAVFSTNTNRWMAFTITPMNEPLTCSITFMDFDKQTREKQKLLSHTKTENIISQVSKTLVSTVDFNKGVRMALKEINSFIHSDYLFMIEIKGDKSRAIFEYEVKDNNEYIYDIKGNLYLSLVKSWDKYLDENGIIEINEASELYEKSIFAYRDLQKKGISRAVVVPLKNLSGKILGYLGAINYEKDDAFNLKEIFKETGMYMASRIVMANIHDELKRQSEFDSLTGIFNRNGFNTEVKSYFKHNKNEPCVSVVLDIDNFKFINDLNGHVVGDETLKDFAKTLTEIFGEHSIIGRTGGDEFVVLIKNMDLDAARPLISKFRNVKKSFVFNDSEYEYEVSMGCAEYPKQAKKWLELSMKADAALYYVKSVDGIDAISYNDNMDMEKNRSQLGFGLRDIAGNMPCAMLIFDATESGKILYVNDELIKMYNCKSREELIEFTGGTFRGLIQPNYIKYVEDNIWKQIHEANGGYDNIYLESKGQTKDGKIENILLNARLVNSKYYGQVFYAILIDLDKHKNI